MIALCAALSLFGVSEVCQARPAEYKAVYGKDVHLSTVRDPETGNWMLLISVGKADVHRQNMANFSKKQILNNVIIPLRRAIKKAGGRVRFDHRAITDLDSMMTEYDATLLRPPTPKALQTAAARIVRPESRR